MIRILVTLGLLLVCSIAQSQDKNDAKPKVVEVVHLNFIQASDAERMLKNLGVEGNLVADIRTNTIVVSGDEVALKKIKELLSTIDVSIPDNESTSIYPTDVFQHAEGDGAIIRQIAESSGVDLAVDKDLGLVMVKGPKDQVERALTIIEKIRMVSEQKQAEKKIEEQKAFEIREDRKFRTEPFALRVLWLSNEPNEDNRNPIEPDAALKKSIEKLGELGFAGMKVKMQLLGRGDINDGKGLCQVEG